MNANAASLQLQERDQVVIVGVTGEESLGNLWKSMETYVERGRKGFIVDLQQVRYLNSTSIAAILTARNKASAHGARLVVANLTDGIRSVFRILKLERLFDLEITVDKAVQLLR